MLFWLGVLHDGGVFVALQSFSIGCHVGKLVELRCFLLCHGELDLRCTIAPLLRLWLLLLQVWGGGSFNGGNERLERALGQRWSMRTPIVNLAVVSTRLHVLSWDWPLAMLSWWAAFYALNANFWCYVDRLHRKFSGTLTALVQDFLLLLAPGFLELWGLERGMVFRAHALDYA